MAPNQRRLVRLSLNENPFGPSPRALDAIRSGLADLSSYTGDELHELTSLISKRESISAEQIVLGEILQVFGLSLSARGGAGGEFIYSVPGYTALVDAVAPAGGVAIGVPLNSRLENDLPAIADRVSSRTRAVYLVNPHNPSGTVSDAAQFNDFVRELSRLALVIVDEAYLEFMPDFEERTIAPLVREGANVAVFRTFSKIYGLASLAFGYVLAPKELAAALKQTGIGAFFDVNLLSIRAAQSSLEDTHYVATVREAVKVERDAWHDWFRARGLRHASAQGNFVFFDTGRAHHVVAAALAEQQIVIGRSQPPLDTWARISIGLPDDNRFVRQTLDDLLS